MAYDTFQPDKPDGADSGPTVIDDTRKNLRAIRDAAMMGTMPEWAMEPQNSDGSTPPSDPAQPEVLMYSRSTERLKLSITWGSSGGNDGNPTQIAYEYSADSGSTWESIGTETITYDSAGNVTGTSWA